MLAGDDVTHKLVQRLTYRQIAQLAVHLIEFFQRGGGTLQFGVFTFFYGV